MAAATDFSVYTLPPSPPKWGAVGIFYVTFCATWTVLVLVGMAACWHNRHSPVIKIRGLLLSFGAILFLHLYWILGQITYTVGGTLPLVLAYDVQYFFMGIWFPLGIALFHASNSRFLHVAKLQKQYVQPEHRPRTGCHGGDTSWLCRLRNMNYTARIMIFIGTAMLLQVLLTIGMWCARLKYHPTWGIPGTQLRGKTLEQQIIHLGRGWEWWPSVLWQVIWTWMVAPILIWRSWKIRDTMGWKTQTIGCCVSSLHATPMFMIASYVPAFEPVNVYFAPSEWIHLSILMFEVFTIFVPLFQLLRLRMLSRKAARSSARWETASQTTTLRTSPSVDRKFSSLSWVEKGDRFECFAREIGSRLYSMSALEYVLDENPTPLQEFSALNDFSGENIAFLTRAAHWKSSWPKSLSAGEIARAFKDALDIYVDFISPKDAKFPLNLSSADLKQLQAMFDEPARAVYGESQTNPATPFDMDNGFRDRHERSRLASASATGVNYQGEIPESFDSCVFDAVQAHIKYLVLTNTWPKFIEETQQKRRSSETGRSIGTSDSNATLVSRASAQLHTLFHSLLSA